MLIKVSVGFNRRILEHPLPLSSPFSPLSLPMVHCSFRSCPSCESALKNSPCQGATGPPQEFTTDPEAVPAAAAAGGIGIQQGLAEVGRGQRAVLLMPLRWQACAWREWWLHFPRRCRLRSPLRLYRCLLRGKAKKVRCISALCVNTIVAGQTRFIPFSSTVRFCCRKGHVTVGGHVVCCATTCQTETSMWVADTFSHRVGEREPNVGRYHDSFAFAVESHQAAMQSSKRFYSSMACCVVVVVIF